MITFHCPVTTDQTENEVSFNQNSRFFVTGKYSFKCEPVDYSQEPETLRALDLAWIFYFSKMIDMIDSVIFLMKKKFSNRSFHQKLLKYYS